MAASANITDEEVTTAQLTAPAGKDGGDFQAGMMKDLGETAEGIDLGSGKYTEIEFCIEATDQAEIGETYEFRVTAQASGYYPVGADCVLYHAYWDGTATDHSSYGNDGTVTGPTFVENAISFDGNDDRIVVAHDASIAPSDAISVYMWMYIADGDWDDYDIPLFKSTTTAWSDGYGFYLVASNFRIDFFVNGYTHSATIYHYRVGHLLDGEDHWNLYCATYNKTNIIEYEDVSYSQSTAYDQNINSSTHDLLVGYDGSGYWFKGKIGELLIFNTAKSSDDITAYFNATKSRYGL